jgi:hypothetical protein
MFVYDVATDTWTTIDKENGDDEVVLISDIDQDGIAEVVVPSGSFELDGTPIAEMDGGLESTGLLAADVDGDGFPGGAERVGSLEPTRRIGDPWNAAFNPGYRSMERLSTSARDGDPFPDWIRRC